MDGREKKVRKSPMGRANNKHDHVSEAILIEILARLPLRSISRFKSVCKTWKSATETEYFRRVFVSLHKNSSSSWSLVVRGNARELINLHSCETWDLPKSIACYIPSHITGNLSFSYMDSSNGLVWMDGYGTSFVGNPVLQQWVRIPSRPYQFATLPFGMVTRVDEDGVVLGFKLIRIAGDEANRQESLTYLCLCVYSSETGVWSKKRLVCFHYFTNWAPPMALNGTLYITPSGFDDPAAVPGVLIAHDFYGESNLTRVIPLPDHDPDHNRYFKRALTTSAGSLIYIKTLGHNLLKVWMLTNNDDWQLLWEIHLPFITCDDDILYYAPLAMHPFDCNLVYLWSQHKRYLVSCNLQTQSYQILSKEESDECLVNQSTCEQHMNVIFEPDSVKDCEFPVPLSNFVLPRWMESLPCPPQVEMMDTTSLLACVLQMELKANREEFEDIYGIRKRLLHLQCQKNNGGK